MAGQFGTKQNRLTRSLSRRGLLRAAGGSAAALALPSWLPSAVNAAQDATPIPGPRDAAWYDLANRLRG